MDDTERRRKTWMWCFWISVAVVLLVFFVPVETKSYGNVSISYTMWEKITGSGPSTMVVRTTNNDPYP